MRTDLTTPFQNAMSASGRRPRLLAVFHFAAGDVHVSDQALGATDGLADEYSALVEDWGDLRGAGDPMSPEASEIRQMIITLWNGGTTPFSDYFLDEDPEDILVDVYQWFYGIAESNKALIDTFVCQDPIQADEVSRLLRIDLVSIGMLYDNPVGDLLTLANWPNAREQDIGKYIPVVIGSPGYVRTLVARTAPKATLDGSILTDTVAVTSNEDLDAEGFPQSGTIQIGGERMTYSSRTENDFIISQRGADGTTAAEHLNQEEIQEHVTDFTYIIGKGGISAVNGVKVAGLPAPSSIYTAYTALDPARLVFSEKPYAMDYSRGSTFLEMQFDAVNQAVNTAIQPHLAYDDAAVTSAAQINETYSLLAVQQKTVNPDRGEIVKAYLAVEWWADGIALTHDRVKVSIVGIGDLGYLEFPNEDDNLSLDAEVDIDHGHSHSISGEHRHLFSDPTYATQEDPHLHGSSGLSVTQRVHATSQVSVSMNGTDVKSTTVPGPAGFSGATLHFRTSPNYGCGFKVGGGAWIQGGSGDANFSISPGSGTVTIYFKWLGSPFPNIQLMVFEIYIDYLTNTSIDMAYTGVGMNMVSSGALALDSDKTVTDVNDLATDNVAMEVIDSGLPTRTVVELFDITDYVALEWGWFTDKEIRVAYDGTVDDVTVFILHVFFDIEFRRSERLFSDEVTVDVDGLIDDDDGTYTDTANAVITRPDHVRKWLLMARGDLPASLIDSASFTAAGVRYAALDYTFDGVLDGAMTVREADKKLARECRSRWFWDAGKAFMKLKEVHDDWTIDKSLTQSTSAIRMKGTAMQRKNVMDMVNRANLYYYRDWTKETAGVEGYLSMTTRQNNESIYLHGIRERNDRFTFDLVRDATMAADLAEFYLEDGALSQFYTIDTFLPYFDLQKEDHFELTHDFMSLSKAAMRVADIERIFGSGKLKRMNLLRIIAETWYRLIRIAKGDSVKVADLLHIDFLFADQIINQVGVSDLLQFGFNYDDEVTVSEALAIVTAWVISQADTVTATDTLVANMGVALSDSVTVTGYLDKAIGAGFGLGQFGLDRFGSMNEFDANPEEFVAVLDELVSALSAVLSDTVTVTDTILFSSGFGSPWTEGEGFGAEPFGR